MTTISLGNLWLLGLEGLGARLVEPPMTVASGSGQLILMVLTSAMMPGLSWSRTAMMKGKWCLSI